MPAPAADDVAIELEPDPAFPRWVAQRAGREVGEVRMARLPSGALAIDHVEVVPALRGSGLAERLVGRAVAEARAGGDRLVPRCSYAAALFRRRPEWRDLLA